MIGRKSLDFLDLRSKTQFQILRFLTQECRLLRNFLLEGCDQMNNQPQHLYLTYIDVLDCYPQNYVINDFPNTSNTHVLGTWRSTAHIARNQSKCRRQTSFSHIIRIRIEYIYYIVSRVINYHNFTTLIVSLPSRHFLLMFKGGPGFGLVPKFRKSKFRNLIIASCDTGVPIFLRFWLVNIRTNQNGGWILGPRYHTIR